MSVVPAGSRSLTSITVRRAIISGRIYLGIATGIAVFYCVVFSFTGAATFASVVPLLLPIMATVGSTGGLLVFTNDRLKGVLEYLLAYGLSPRALFANVLVAAIAVTAIVLGVSITIGLGVFLALGNPFTVELAEAIFGYSVPMALVSVALASTVGMFWSSLSSPREGMSSPTGLMPVIGILPSIVTLVAALALRNTDPLLVTEAAVGVVALIVLALLSMTSRLLPAERLLSPA